MLAALPILSWIALIGILLLARRPLREGMLIAGAFWGGILVLLTESLSLLRCFHTTGLAIAWATTLVSLLIVMAKQLRRRKPARLRLWETFRNAGLFPRIALYLLVSQAVLLALVAIHYRPNTYDSMTYHMTRVMLWQQNQSVAHFATLDIREIHHPPFAEFVIAHLQILTAGDRLANLVQWFAMIHCALAVSLIAKELGGRAEVQWGGALLGTSIPMAVLQATSTQTDYVCAAWLCAFVYFGLRLRQERNILLIVTTALSLGLAILTKPLAYIFGLPFCIFFGISILRKENWKAVQTGALIAIIVLGINFGHFARNWKLYGFIYSHRVSDHQGLPGFSLAYMASNMIRIAGLNVSLEKRGGFDIGGLHIARIIGQLNEFHLDFLDWLHGFTGLSPTDPDTMIGAPNHFRNIRMHLHEDYAGSPLHFFLMVVTCIVIAVSFLFSRKRPFSLAFYLCCLLAGFMLFCSIFQWQEWINRFMLILVLLWCPAIAVALLHGRHRLLLAVPVIIALYSFHWIQENRLRPLTGSVLLPGRANASSYFANQPHLESWYQLVTSSIIRKGCHDIGLAIGMQPYDYPLWALFAEASYPVTMRYIKGDEESAALLDHSFQPCAVFSENRFTPEVTKPAIQGDSEMVYYPQEQPNGAGALR